MKANKYVGGMFYVFDCDIMSYVPYAYPLGMGLAGYDYVLDNVDRDVERGLHFTSNYDVALVLYNAYFDRFTVIAFRRRSGCFDDLGDWYYRADDGEVVFERQVHFLEDD